jgi:SAM-dependent methyltransferase
MERSLDQDLAAACEVCGSQEFQPFAQEAGFPLVRCLVCRLVFVSPQPDKETLASWYARKINAEGADDYWAGYIAKESSFRSHSRYVLSLIRPLARPPGRLLEIGCGPGFFLDEAREVGWEVCGMDLAESFVTWGREKLGLDLRLGELEEGSLPAEHFDAVVMLDVLSHVPAPRRTVGEISRILRPGGVLFMQTGVKAEAEVKRPDDDWETPLHLFHFTRETLRRLLEGGGFEVVRMQLAPQLPVPGLGRRLGQSIPLARALYRFLRRAAGIVCSAGQAAHSTVYLAARKQ